VDIEASLKTLLAASAKARQDVRDIGGGNLIATEEDTDGNIIGLL